MILDYFDFINEKFEDLLLESLDDNYFFLSDKLSDILTSMVNSDSFSISKISDIYLSLDIEKSDLNMSYFDIGDDNQSINYLSGNVIKNKLKGLDIRLKRRKGFEEVPSGSIRIGRLTKKIIDLYNKKRNTNITFTESEIEQFVNAYKFNWEFENNKMDYMSLVSGASIGKWYSEENYSSESGTLGNSCMKYTDCSDFFDMYESNDVSLLILLTPDKLLQGRALVWTLSDGSKFMDRVYTTHDSDVDFFITWAKENKCSYKKLQDSKISEICNASNGFKPEMMKLEVNVYTTSYNNREYEKFPYMDTLKYYYWKEGKLRNWKDGSKYFIELQSTDGWCECLLCGNGGVSQCLNCEGSGLIECNECNGDIGIMDCVCSGSGNMNCTNCDGAGEDKCTRCGGFSYND